MKKKRIIYAVQGMMEYQTIVKVGRNSVKVGFSGGSISNGCAQPARYSTSSLIMQNAIEACEDYRRGRIRRERVITLDEDIVVERNRPASKLETMLREAGSPAGNCSSGMEAPAFPQAAPADSGAIEMSPDQVEASAGLSAGEEVGEAEGQAAPVAVEASAGLSVVEAVGEAVDEAAPEPAPVAVAASAGLSAGEEAGEAEGQAAPAADLQVVEASCKDVAKQYLQEHYGENPSRLRTRDDVQACAAKYGITFSFV